MGNLFSKVFESLKTFTIRRRENKYSVHRYRSDHPELNSSDQLILVTDNNQTGPSTAQLIIGDNDQIEVSSVQVTITDNEQTGISREAASVTHVVVPSQQCSDFYWACRNNDMEKVKKLLETISQDEIDQLEPNGSTALHAASYHGHADIVRLLLERGADRSIQNKFHCLPFDEASTDEIRELFLRIPTSNRLIMNTGAIEWELVDDDVLENAAQERQIIKSLYDNDTGTTPVDKMFEKIEKNYIDKGLTNIKNLDSIRHFFEKATKEKDPKWIIKAYTAETDFYNVLNAEIAGGASKYQSERRYIITLLSHHPILDSLTFLGTSYRVMEVNDFDLQKYEINKLSMTKSFLSSSIDQNIAAWFLCRQEMERKNSDTTITRHNKHGDLIKSWVMCKYQIKHRRTALHIENSSQYANEGEVLIMPYTVFKVKNKKPVAAPYLTDGQKITEIEFEECDQYINT